MTAEQLRVAIVMILRAPCKGEEATGVAATLEALMAEYSRVTKEDEDGNDA